MVIMVIVVFIVIMVKTSKIWCKNWKSWMKKFKRKNLNEKFQQKCQKWSKWWENWTLNKSRVQWTLPINTKGYGSNINPLSDFKDCLQKSRTKSQSKKNNLHNYKKLINKHNHVCNLDPIDQNNHSVSCTRWSEHLDKSFINLGILSLFRMCFSICSILIDCCK
jgi:hypothetical protein